MELPRFDDVDGTPGSLPRDVPVRRVGDRLVTTVFDLMLAQYGVGREGLGGDYATSYDDATAPYTPAWQEAITGVPASAAARIAREFAQNAEESKGRSMILMGAGTNHWFHSDTIYRGFLGLTTLTGCQGVNGGGWAHYVGQEKCRPVTGWAQLAFGLDWKRPPRQMIHTAYWYLHTDQFRYDTFGADTVSAKTGSGLLAGMSTADVIAKSARMGWMPSYPTFDRNPLDLADEAAAAGRPVAEHVVDQLKSGDLRFAAEDPDAPENFPRVLAIWRANLLGSSGKGNEYFLKHLLGTDNSLRAGEASEGQRPQEVEWHDERARGKARPAAHPRLPPDQHHDLLRRRAARRHVVREARPQHHRHAPVHPLVQPGDRAAVADPHRLGRLADDRHQVQRARRGPARHPHGRRRRAAAARHPRRDGQPARRGPRLEARRVRAGPRRHDAQDRRGRARLHRRRRAAAGPRTAAREARHDHQGRDLRREGRRRLPAAQERRDPRRSGRRATLAGARRPRLRGDPGAVRDHQRAPGHPGLQDPGEAHRHPAARPRGRARGQADHLRRHGGRAGAGDHLTGVVRLGDRRAALLAVHDQRRAAQALAHADRAASTSTSTTTG